MDVTAIQPSFKAKCSPPLVGRAVIPIDIIKASGLGRLENPDGSAITLGPETRYRAAGMGEYADPNKHLHASLGLLNTLSVADLKQTDLYVFRASTGELVIERRGIEARDLILTDNQPRFRIDLTLPGPGAITSAGALFQGVEAFQEQSGIQQGFRGAGNANFPASRKRGFFMVLHVLPGNAALIFRKK